MQSVRDPEPQTAGDAVLASYHVHEKLGEGAMGAVYRATHRVSGQEVALKRVLAWETRSGGKGRESAEQALMGEFRILAALHHPHVIGVLDYGLDAMHRPYLAMELLKQPSTLLQAAAQKSTEDKVDYLVQVLRALTYVHRSGILHRDLKPSNVLVQGDAVKLVDFGVAAPDSSAAGSTHGGTVAYLPPEFFCGAERTAAADLYALGVVAHELLQGGFPFDFTDPQSFVTSLTGHAPDAKATIPNVGRMFETLATLQTVGTTPTLRTLGMAMDVELEGSVAECDGPFGAILTRLLARNPRERYTDPRDVIADLAKVIGKGLTVESTATRESLLRAARFVGRDAEIQKLTSALRSAIAGHSSSYLLAGESGVGKSRILDELRTVGLVSGVLVLRGQGTAEGGQLYQLWLGAIRTLCSQTNLSDAEASVLTSLVADLPQLLNRPLAPPPALPPDQAQQRLLGVIVTLFSRQTRPMLVMLEDMHWCGADSLAVLQALQALPKLPLLIVGSYRDDECPDLPGKLPFMRVIKLNRLDPSAIAELVRAMLGQDDSTASLAQFLHEQTEGNVFFLIEMIRKIADDLSENAFDPARLQAQVLTGGIRQIVARRLSRVDEKAHDVLKAAAIMGRSIDGKALAAMFADLDLSQWLTRCANAAVLDAQEAQWRFAHDKLREVLLEGLSPDEAQRLHGAAACAIEAAYPNSDEHAARLAYHWHRAGVADKAVPYYEKAAAAATELNAYVPARSYYAEALALLAQMPPGPAVWREQVDTIIKQALISWATDSPERALASMMHGHGLLTKVRNHGEFTDADRGREARLLFHIGRSHYAQNSFSKAMAFYQQAIALSKDLGEEELFTLASSATGAALILSGHFGQGVEVFTPVVDLIEKHAGFVEWTRARGCLSWGLAAAGRISEAVECTGAAVPRAAALNHRTGIAFSYTYLPMVYFLAGQYGEAETHARLMIDASHRAGEKILIFLGETFLTWAAIRADHYDQACAARDRAERIRAELGGKVLLGDWADLAKIDILLHSGREADTQEAKIQADRMAESTTGRDVPFVEGLVHRALGTLAGRAGDFDGAATHFGSSCIALRRACADVEVARTLAAWSRTEQRAHPEMAAKLAGDALELCRKLGVV